MADLRDQMLKAGLVSSKQVRQAKHAERVHRKEVGPDGIAAERTQSEEAFREQLEIRRRQDREREETRRRREADEQSARALQNRIRAGWIREATSGTKRFFFAVDQGRITFLDLSDEAVRQLLSGRAAIVESRGIVRGEYCVINIQTAQSLAKEHAELICFLSRAAER